MVISGDQTNIDGDQTHNKDSLVMKNVKNSPVNPAETVVSGGPANIDGDQNKIDGDQNTIKEARFPSADASPDFVREREGDEKAGIPTEKVLPPEHPDAAATYLNMALNDKKQGKYDEALQWFGKALAIHEKVSGGEHPSMAMICFNIGDVYQARGDLKEALVWYGKSLAIVEKTLGKGHPGTALMYNSMACVARASGDLKEALVWHGEALRINHKAWGPNDPHFLATRINAEITHQRAGRDREKPFQEWLEEELETP